MAGVKIIGIEKIQKKLRQNVQMADVKKVVRHNGAEMQVKAQQNAPVDTGTLKRSIGIEITDGGMTARWSRQRLCSLCGTGNPIHGSTAILGTGL